MTIFFDKMFVETKIKRLLLSAKCIESFLLWSLLKGRRTDLLPCQTAHLLSDSNRIRTHYHLVRKQTLNHLAKLLCRFTLNRVRDMIITYSQVSTPYRTVRVSTHNTAQSLKKEGWFGLSG